MRELFKNYRSGFLNIFSLQKKEPPKTAILNGFPLVGFLTEEKKLGLESALGIKIIHTEYFEQALIHRSYLQILSDEGVYSNERLEFLGDSVLGIIISEHLFSLHRDLFEGELTKMRSWLVNKKSLALCARRLNLDKFLMLSYSAEKSLRSGSESILGDGMEAIIAAIYLDSGYYSARNFVINSLLPIMMNQNVMIDKNFKSILLETVQAQGKNSPNYEVIEEKGPDHDKEFTVGVYVDGVLLGTGVGRSKKEAEQEAAHIALEKHEAY